MTRQIPGLLNKSHLSINLADPQKKRVVLTGHAGYCNGLQVTSSPVPSSGREA
jgi:hypothetical protein